jgi:hypothetical protein
VDEIEPEFAVYPDADRCAIPSCKRRVISSRFASATQWCSPPNQANEDWDQAALNAAITNESLSIAADNTSKGLQQVVKDSMN